jgi:hypothetical protein
MGANAQLAVPVFTAGQVLTAAQQTQINTGIPVFATTVTRDAAFGGAGEKVLAQGQYAYIEATSSLQVYTGAAWTNAISSGLNLVKTQTIGSAVATVEVTDAFSATYENYLITVSGGASSSSNAMRMILGATTAGYYISFANAPYDGSGIAGVQTNNGAIWGFVGFATTSGINMFVNLQSPQLAKLTFISAPYANLTGAAGTGTGQSNGFLNNTTQYTSFTISPSGGTLTGGTIRVYGYQNS